MATLATWWVWIAALALGRGVLALADRGADRSAACPAPRGAVERWSLSILLGFSLLTCVCTAAVWLLGPPAPWAVRTGLVAAALLGALLAYLCRGVRASVDSAAAGAGEPWNRLDRVLAAGLVWFCGFVLVYGATMPMHVFDPVYHFAYKGKVLFHEGFGGDAWTDMQGPVGRIMTHPNYPPGLPALHVLVAGAGGEFDEDATRPLMGWYALSAIGLLLAALASSGRRRALLGALCLAGLPLLFYSQLPRAPITWTTSEAEFMASLHFSGADFLRAALALLVGSETAQARFPAHGPFRLPDGWTLDGAADLPLAALILGAAYCLVRARARGNRGDLWLAGALLGGAGLMKNEGLALAAVMLVCFAAHGLWSRRTLRSALELWPTAVLFALLLAPWMELRGEIPSVDEDYPAAIARLLGAENAPQKGPNDQSPESAQAAWERVPVVLAGFGQSFANLLRWNLLWVLFAAALLAQVSRPREFLRHPLLPVLAAVLAALAVFALVLLVTPWDLAVLYTTAIPDRLLLQVAPLALWFALFRPGHDPGPLPRGAGH